jgi:CRISPR-associated protein Cmr2
MGQQLLLLTIGPVQEFIASARRSRDLWFGSWLLSELAKAAAAAIAVRHGHGALIFPAPHDPEQLQPGSDFSVANRIIALLPGGTARATAAAARAALDQRLAVLWNDAYAALPRAWLDIASAVSQRDDLVEFAWVALPVSAYDTTRAKLEAWMAARKATRTFGPVTWSARRDKSSLDGLRESVILRELTDELTEQKLYEQLGVRTGEHLCGIGLLKRHGRRAPAAGDTAGGNARFFSTSHVAALPLLGRIGPEHAAAVATYIAALQAAGISRADLGFVPGPPNGAFGHYDGHLLFEERLNEYIDAGQQGDETARTTQRDLYRATAKTALRQFFKAVFGKTVTPCPYYALLHADGDGMGRAIDAQPDARAHQALSRTLDAFAFEVRRIVAEHRGSLVYAGGDDVLAFLPLPWAVACARALADRFATLLQPYQYKTSNGSQASPTLSAGIAIEHHLSPLSDALEHARDVERLAKRSGRNALAVMLSPRSGASRTVCGSWDGDGTPYDTLDKRLEAFAAAYAAGRLPDGLAFEWARLHQRLRTDDQALGERLLTPLRLDARRILERKRGENAARMPAETEQMLGALADRALLFAPAGTAGHTLEHLADELVIARTLAEAVRQASVPTPEQADAARAG